MSPHPAPEVLYECAAHEDPAVLSHVRSCPECATRYARVAAGAALIRATRDESTPPVAWKAIDATVMAAAARTAEEIRRGSLRSPRRIGTTAFVGLTLAAAAAGVFAFRAGVFTRAPATSEVAVAPRGNSGNALTPGPAHPATAVEGVVLLVAAPVTFTASGSASAPLAATTVIREGARLAVVDHAGRAVVALQPGYRVDLRTAADVTVSRLRSDRTTLALAKGELRVDAPARDEGRVAVEAAGWTLVSKGGSFTASVEGEVIRLRVLSGKVGVRRGDAAEREINAHEEVELAKNGPDLRMVSHDAQDAHELDGSFLSSEGAVLNLPELPAGASLLRVGAGALPDGLTALRVGMAVSLEAHRGAESWSLRLDPGAAVPATAWDRMGPVAGTTPVLPRPSATRAPTVAAMSARRAPSATVGEGSRVREELSPQARAGLRAVVQSLGARTRSCFEICARSGNCGDAAQGSIQFQLDDAGHVVSAPTTGFTPALNACVEREARSVPFPAEMGGARVPLQIRNPLHIPTP